MACRVTDVSLAPARDLLSSSAMPRPRAPLWSVLACAAAAAGCVGQSSGGGGNPADAPGGTGTDGRPGDGGMMMIDAPAPFTCRNKVTPLDNGHHNQGQDCQQSCHNHGFFLSGTAYTSPAGGTALVGATITFIDANGFVGDTQTSQNGNFWWAALPIAFPVKIYLSSCPDIQQMGTMVDATGAGCNKAGCHAGGGSAGRIHLP